MGFISRYVREQKRYTKNEIKCIFDFSESEAESFIRRLKSFGIMKAVKNTAGQRDLSDLSDADIEIADDAGESSECFYVFTYVGVLTIGDRVIKCFPKYITQNDAPDTEMKQVIRVLRRYGSKEQIVNLYNGDGQSSSFNILAVMLFLLEDYHQYGAYINSEDIVEVNGEGPILWGQTIDNGFAVISNNRPYYVDIYTHRSINDEQDFFHRLHRCIVSESSRQLRDAGLIDLFDLVEADISNEVLDDFGDKEYILYRLHSELGVQFNTHKQTVLKTLYALSYTIVPLPNQKESVCTGRTALTWCGRMSVRKCSTTNSRRSSATFRFHTGLPQAMIPSPCLSISLRNHSGRVGTLMAQHL